MDMGCVQVEQETMKSTVLVEEVDVPEVQHILMDGGIDYETTAAVGEEQSVWPYCHPFVALFFVAPQSPRIITVLRKVSDRIN